MIEQRPTRCFIYCCTDSQYSSSRRITRAKYRKLTHNPGRHMYTRSPIGVPSYLLPVQVLHSVATLMTMAIYQQEIVFMPISEKLLVTLQENQALEQTLRARGHRIRKIYSCFPNRSRLPVPLGKCANCSSKRIHIFLAGVHFNKSTNHVRLRQFTCTQHCAIQPSNIE